MGWQGRMAVALLLAGCMAAERPATPSPVVEELAALPPPPQAVVKTPSQPPPDVTRALLPPMPVDPKRFPVQAALDSRVDVHVEHATARDFFMGLVQGTRIGMMVHPEIRQEISLGLRNVTIRQAVSAACDMYQFDCRLDAGGYTIQPRRLVIRSFAVDFLPVFRRGRTQTTVSAGQISESTSMTGDQTSTTRNTTGSDLVTEYEADFWQDLESSLRAIIGLPVKQRFVIERQSKGTRWGQPRKDESRQVYTEGPEEGDEALARRGGRSVVVNPQAGLVVVRAMPDEMIRVEEFLAQLRASSRRQVLLEAKILEVVLDDGYQYGIDWLAIHRGLNRMPPLAGEPNGATTFRGSTPVLTGVATTTTVDNQNNTSTTSQQPVGSIPYIGAPSSPAGSGMAAVLAGAANQAFSLALRAHDFVAFIDVLKQQGEVNVLSSPRVATANNQKAVIKVGQDEIFITDVEIHATQGANAQANPTENVDPKFTPFFSGVALDVTPQISAEGLVTLHVHPMVTEVQDKLKVFKFNDKMNEYPLAFSQSREADSIIQVRDGDVAVIGGLMKKQQREEDRRVPGLGDLPVVGGLFGHTAKSWVKSELIILLRPVIIQEQEGWRPQLEQTTQRVQSLRHPPDGQNWPMGTSRP